MDIVSGNLRVTTLLAELIRIKYACTTGSSKKQGVENRKVFISLISDFKVGVYILKVC